MKYLIVLLLSFTINAQVTIYYGSADTTVAGGGDTYITTGLILVYDDDSLSNGSVSSFPASVGGVTLAQGTGSAQPTMTDSGLVFDGGDRIENETYFELGDMAEGLTVEMVVKVADSTAEQRFFIVGNPEGRRLYLNVWDGKMGAYFHDSTGTRNGRFNSLPFMEDGTTYVTFVYHPDSTLKAYANAVGQVRIGTTVAGHTDLAEKVAFGSSDFQLPNGTIIRYLAVREGMLTDEQITTNYNSTRIQAKLP